MWFSHVGSILEGTVTCGKDKAEWALLRPPSSDLPPRDVIRCVWWHLCLCWRSTAWGDTPCHLSPAQWPEGPCYCPGHRHHSSAPALQGLPSLTSGPAWLPRHLSQLPSFRGSSHAGLVTLPHTSDKPQRGTFAEVPLWVLAPTLGSQWVFPSI